MGDSNLKYEQPDFFIPESEKDKEWYANAVRFYTNTYFNRPFYSFSNRNTNIVGDRLSPIDEIVRNWSYYLGEQDIGLNSALINGGFAKLLYRPGLEINSLVTHKVGQIENILQSSKPTSDALNKDVRSTKQFLEEIILMQLQEKQLVEQLQLAGVFLNPIPEGIEISTVEEFEKKKEFTLKEFGEVICDRIASKISVYNNLIDKYIECTRQCIVGGIVGLDLYVKNGMLCVDLVPAHQNIWDNSKTDDYLTDKRIAGRVFYRLTSGEVISRWGDQLTKSEIAEINSGRDSDMSNFLSIYNAPVNGYNLWCYSDNGTNIEGYSAVKMYFKGHRNFMYIKNKRGKLVMLDESGIRNTGDYSDEAWYTATLIGNKYLVDFGLAENIPYEVYGSVQPQCPLVQVVPNMTLDQYKSDVSKIRQIQDEIDYYANKIKEKAIRDYGKNYIIRGKALLSDSIEELLEDFRAQGITITTESGEVANDDLQANRDVQLVDLTLDPNVIRYVELKSTLVREMREIMSLPDAAIGLQRTIIGKAVQENTMQASNTGLAPFYNTMLNFFQRVIQTAVNMQKLSFSANDMEDIIEEIVGVDGRDYIKTTSGFSFDFYGVYLSISDMIKQGDRDKLIAEAGMAIQGNPELLPYLVKLRRFETYTEAENYLDYIFKVADKKRMERDKNAMENQRIVSEQSSAAQIEKANIMKDAQIESAEKRKQATENAAMLSKQAKDRASEIELIKSTR